MSLNQMIFTLNLLINTATFVHNECLSRDFFIPFNGRYCPSEGIINANLSWHQCKLYCLHTPSCESVNYNFTADLCAQLTTTCPKAVSHPDMAFVLLRGKQPEHCLEWIPKQDGDPVRDRSVTEDDQRFVARMQKDGNDFVCYLGLSQYNCLSSDGNGGKIQSRYGHPCQYLRIRDGCTVMYVDYELGTPLPHMAPIGGYTADGRSVYIGLGKNNLPGYYIPGSKKLVAGFHSCTSDVQILVLI